MVFSSPVFLGLFFPALLCIYFFANNALRNYILLAFSLLFYAWGEPYAVWVMVALSVINYVLGLLISLSKNRYVKLGFLWAGVVICLGSLIYYKYMMLLAETFLPIARMAGADYKVPQIALPIGISFYVFQIVSYLTDVYRNDVSAQRLYGVSVRDKESGNF